MPIPFSIQILPRWQCYGVRKGSSKIRWESWWSIKHCYVKAFLWQMPTAPLSYIPPHQTLYSSMANCMCHFCCLHKRYRTSMMFSCNYYVLIWNTNCGVLSAVSEAGVNSVLVLAIFALSRLTWRGWKLRIQLVSGLCQKKESSRLRGGVLSDRASGNPNGIPSTSEALWLWCPSPRKEASGVSSRLTP